jgi:hypothetical protein
MQMLYFHATPLKIAAENSEPEQREWQSAENRLEKYIPLAPHTSSSARQYTASSAPRATTTF